jgi:hypothetical protein
MTGFTLGTENGATLGGSAGGTLGVADDEWLIDGFPVGRVTDELATHQTLELTIRTTTETLESVLRPLKPDEGKVNVLMADDGGFSAVDRANGSNTFTLTPPPRRQPLRRKTEWHVQRYEEDLVSEEVREWSVELEFARNQNREDVFTVRPGDTGNEGTQIGADAGGTLGESTGFTLGGPAGASLGNTAAGVANDEWGLSVGAGTIVTGRVDADVLGTGEGGVERYELITRVTFEQAYAFESNLSRLGGGRIKNVPDAANIPLDETADGAVTVTIDAPDTQDTITNGDYLVTSWQSERLSEAYQQLTMTVAAKD